MSSANEVANGQPKANGLMKVASLREANETPVAGIERPLSVGSDQERLSKGPNSDEAEKGDTRPPNGKERDVKRASNQMDTLQEGDVLSPTKDSGASRDEKALELKKDFWKAIKVAYQAQKERSSRGDNVEREVANLEVIDEDEKTRGIRHRSVTKKGDKKVILRSEDPSESSAKGNPAWWLTTIENENDLQESSWEIQIADKEVIACIRNTIYEYLVHTGGSFEWKTDQINLKQSFVAVVLNWSNLKQISERAKDKDVVASAGLKTAAHGPDSTERYSRRTYERVGSILKYIQGFVPRPIEILENQVDEIEFDYLWALFRPGRLVVSTWSQDSIEYPQVFKVSHSWTDEQDPHCAYLKIEAWMFDWNGTDIDRSLFHFSVPSFETTSGASVKKIRSLKVYPVEYYMSDSGKTGIAAISAHEVYQDRRKRFIEYAITGEGKLSPSRLRYAGEVLHTEIKGPHPWLYIEDSYILDEKLLRIRRVKIDENIILDAENYIRKGLGGRLLGKLVPIRQALCNCTLCLDPETQMWLKDLRKGYSTENNAGIDLLLPPRLFGYALGKKCWFQFSIDRIKPDHEKMDELEAVIFPRNISRKEQKNIVQMVKNYSNFMAHPDQRIGDFIGGKGTSLIFLFHGPSGTGKTFCAEALASGSGKSLFKVGISDIGLNAAEAEKNLREIFELAEAWDVILLIDEADVLLDARGNEENVGSLAKNALVSVLLRELEYFKGILIMTTNRLVVLDPAIISRIHYSIYFDHLSHEQEVDLWERWAKRLKEKGLLETAWNASGWLSETLDMAGVKLSSMNGREIRNTWINAQLLSLRENGRVKVGQYELHSCFMARQRFLRESESLKMKAEAHSGMGR